MMLKLLENGFVVESYRGLHETYVKNIVYTPRYILKVIVNVSGYEFDSCSIETSNPKLNQINVIDIFTIEKEEEFWNFYNSININN